MDILKFLLFVDFKECYNLFRNNNQSLRINEANGTVDKNSLNKSFSIFVKECGQQLGGGACRYIDIPHVDNFVLFCRQIRTVILTCRYRGLSIFRYEPMCRQPNGRTCKRIV